MEQRGALVEVVGDDEVSRLDAGEDEAAELVESATSAGLPSGQVVAELLERGHRAGRPLLVRELGRPVAFAVHSPVSISPPEG